MITLELTDSEAAATLIALRDERDRYAKQKQNEYGHYARMRERFVEVIAKLEAPRR